ncbi:hypothetical protein [Paracoccus hibiscisoli]|uniref:Uncharacterized protein n=1 Tax=Paracoccus hibiscisoli TaxID=2023261 RepID=A0A4U0QWF6_9RHOB|nr:hypothetical protein [Paracoccus hibiscisoli]TJZ86140.1 hypothetical protein FA740_04430 [Paracoccus hibiscisoli]
MSHIDNAVVILFKQSHCEISPDIPLVFTNNTVMTIANLTKDQVVALLSPHTGSNATSDNPSLPARDY